MGEEPWAQQGLMEGRLNFEERKRKEKKNKTQTFINVSGGVGAWINHRRKEVGRERRKGGRGERMGTRGVKGRA